MIRRSFIVILSCFNGLLFGQNQDSILKYQMDSLSIFAHPLQTAFILHNNSLLVSDRNEDMAATFGDPSRVLYRSPGVSMANDQANGVVHHGLPGELNIWSVYGG
ncbi:MAG: hypothetical protein HKN09_03305 [Saprospiraceae bacterium]|nr:hypothetical protein [Saprospiraceae bacterium]